MPSRPAPGAGPLGFALFLVSIAVLFVGGIVAWLAVLFRSPVWPPPDRPAPPFGLWSSSALLVLGSVAVHRALAAARAGRMRRLRVSLAVTLALGGAFLLSQALVWTRMLPGVAALETRSFVSLFVFVTGLHAAHVLGGLIPMFVVTRNAYRGRYTTMHHDGVRYCAIYWHFLGGVWFVLCGLLVLSP